MKIFTEYTLDENNRVSTLRFFEADGESSCTATLNEDGKTYRYHSDLDGDDAPVEAPMDLSLADCVLNANVHLGVIPAQNFDPIECNNQH